jgi:hypothetical protein
MWIASFFSNRICWRGLEFRVQKGLLIPLETPVRNTAAFSVPGRADSATPKQALKGTIERTAVLLEPAIDFASRGTPRCDIGLEKTRELT